MFCTQGVMYTRCYVHKVSEKWSPIHVSALNFINFLDKCLGLNRWRPITMLEKMYYNNDLNFHICNYKRCYVHKVFKNILIFYPPSIGFLESLDWLLLTIFMKASMQFFRKYLGNNVIFLSVLYAKCCVRKVF